MRVLFLGTPAFAVPALQMLLDHSYEICGVFTQPDRPSGRGQKMQAGPVKILAQARGIPVFQPDKIRKEDNRAIVELLQPDFVVAAAYGQILPGWLLRSARLAPVNIHASLLPRYRGAAPIPRAILNGETATGVTTMVMHETLDSGPVLLQQKVLIPLTKTAGELAADLAVVGANLLIRTLDGLQSRALNASEQDESQASWAPRITKEMAPVSWEKCALDIHNQIRAMNPWPVAHAGFRNGRLHLWRSLPESQVSDSPKIPGTFLGLSRDGIRVQCGEGTVLDLLEVQMPAKGRVSGREFSSGARLHAGDLSFH
jgi:methionyl-tRNA formyltransferase